jgi:hypothetical protein
MNQLVVIVFLLFTLIVILIIINIIRWNKNKITESFSNNNQYLYPITGLSSICKQKNLKPSYMPKACYVDGVLNSYANCECEDDNGNCKICYDTIKKDSNNSSIVYNANEISWS